MANALTGNPMTIDTAATIWSTGAPKYVKLIQWIDDNADIADDDDLVIAINGVTITMKVQLTANAIGSPVVWELNFGGQPFSVSKFVVTTIDHGTLVVYLA